MNISSPFIHRSVATTLLTAAVALAGGVAFVLLPVSPLPQIDFPTISVSASLPGGSPEVMASSVATPLERQFGRIASVSEMTSVSTLGSSSITIQFDLNRNIDGAARDVQAAINAARAYLPANLPSNPTWRKVNPADAPIMIVALTSDIYDRGTMYDAASSILMQRLSQVPGVGQVTVGGGALPGVRVEVNPTQLNGYGLGLADVANLLSAQNANLAKGQFSDDKTTTDITVNDQLLKAVDYRPLILGYTNGRAVTLSDVAEVDDSVENLRAGGFANGKPSVLVIIFKQPDANIINTVDAVRKSLPALKASIPGGIDFTVMLDRTTTIRASVHDVERTLLISVGLVILVVFLFLRNGKATFIPSVAVPVSLIGTFGIMYLCGFSLDNLSLMALTISTGFVVDDAIVVVENITRYLEKSLSPMQAALRGSREIGFTVLAMSISLCAVFIPILLMGGIIGRMFREFAITLSVAILVSLVVSLTATPMMCSRLLKRHREEEEGWFYRASGKVLNGMLSLYERSLVRVLRHPALTLTILLITVAVNFLLFYLVPKGFFPQQDTGILSGSVQGAQDTSYQAMLGRLLQYVSIVKSDEAVNSVAAFTGGNSATDTGNMFISLKPLAQRKVSVYDVINRLRPKLARVPGANAFLQAGQDLRIGGRQSQAQFQYTITSDNLEALLEWEPKLLDKMKQLPGLADVNSDYRNHGLEESLTYDRPTAARLGITPQSIDTALYHAFGQSQVSTMYTALNQYHVVMEVAPKYWQDPASLNDIYLTATNGGQVPLSAVTRRATATTAIAVNHQGQFPAVTFSFNLLPNVALSDAVKAINEMEQSAGMPSTIRGSFAGTAQAYQASLASEWLLIITALLAVYIVLGILYESFVHPITILSTLPSAGVGAVLALMLTHTDLSVIAIIGIILLIGLVKKNGILMIDFALAAEREEGKSPKDAIFQACLLRFRPILMTTLAAMLGAMPLVLGTGTGSELRRPLGVAIVGGLALSQVLTLYTTPVVYLYLDRYSHWWARVHGRSAAASLSLPWPDATGDKAMSNLTKQAKAGRERNDQSGKLRAAAICLGLALLGGCSFAPTYHVPPVQTPPTFKEAEGWKVAQPKDEVIRGNWWEVFNDPQLNALEEQVAISNQTLVAALANFQEARAVVKEARSQYFPTVTANPSVTKSHSPSGSSSGAFSSGSSTSSVTHGGSGGSTTTFYSLPLDASWEPDLWGTVRNTVKADTFTAQASAANLENMKLTAQADLAADYYALRGQDALKAVLDATVAADQKTLDLTKGLFQAGIDSDEDVSEAETALATVKAQDSNVGIQRAQYEHAIALLLGQPASTFSILALPATTNAPVPPPGIPLAVPSQLLERRPDVAAAERSVAAANAQIGVAKAAFFPTLTLSASAGFQSTSIGSLVSGPSFFWSLGAAAAQTVFDGGLRQATVEQFRAAYDTTVANYRQTVLTAFQQVEDNLAALRILSQEWGEQDAAVQSAQRTLNLATHRYELGIDSYLNVVVAQLTLLNNQQTAVNLHVQQMTSSVQLILALGGGWDNSQLLSPGEVTAKKAP